MGSLTQNAAKGTLLAGKGAKELLGMAVLAVVVLKMTLMAGIVMGPFALVIPVFYALWVGEVKVGQVRNKLESAASGAA